MLQKWIVRIWKYVDSPKTKNAMMTIQGVQVFLRHPHKGISYSKGEMFWGIVAQNILSLYILGLLSFRASRYSILIFIISWWLLLCNILALICKSVIYKMFSSLNETLPADSLRVQMKLIFSKRIYYYNVICTAVCLINNFSSIAISVLIWGFEDQVPDLFLYSMIFILRYFYSMYRFSNYFIGIKNIENPFGLTELEYGDPINQTSFPKLQKGDRCSVCIQRYKKGEKLVEFSCSNGHFYHLNCLTAWISSNPSCPLCKKQLFDD